MLFASLLLTVSTSISGCAIIKNAKDSEVLLSVSNALLTDAPNAFDYTNYNLSNDEAESLSKQKLRSFAVENELISQAQSNYLDNQIKTSSEYTYFPSIKDAFMKDESTSQRESYEAEINLFKNNVIFDGVSSLSVSSSSTNAKPTLNKKETDSIDTASLPFDSMMNGDGTGGGSSTNINLAINTSYDESNVACASSGSVDGTNFFGVVCSPEACIAIYNAMAKFVNNRNCYTASGIKGPLGSIYEILAALASSGVFVTSVVKASAGKIALILDKIIGEFFALFTSGDPIKLIIGVVIFAFASLCVYIFSQIICYGSKGKGYAIGWKIHSLFNWEWFNGAIS